MNITHISAECYPVAKVGGLADVVGSLPIYQNKLGYHSRVIMPFYDNAFTQKAAFTPVYSGTIQLDKKILPFTVRQLINQELGFELFCIDISNLLHTSYVYSNNDTERFMAFQVAALNWIMQEEELPDIIHCHDHHTGLIPFLMSHGDPYTKLQQTPSVFTIHNAQYQGWFSHDLLDIIPKFARAKIGLLDWDRLINPLATAIKCAWSVTTVSPNYMEELKSSANGLESLIRAESDKCVGILNGIDTNVWNPETDPFINTSFSERTNISGKKANKAWLCKKFGLNPKKPLFVFIGRLVGEKGADLFPKLFDTILQDGNLSLLLLGSGIKEVETALEALKEGYPGTYNAFIGYDESLSHNMYAGADFLLMPSRVEPCGLNQLYALRYGTIPVVSSMGGLKDTVVDINDGGFGICHNEITIAAIANAIRRAVDFYKDPTAFKKARKVSMKLDHSWDASAQQYLNTYKTLKT